MDGRYRLRANRVEALAFALAVAFALTLAVTLTQAVSLLFPTAAHADDVPSFSGGVEADFNSRYLWRGLALSNGPVAQPSVWASRGAWTLTLWASRSLDARDGNGWHEFDPSLAWEHEFAGWTLKPTLDLYRYPGTGDAGSAELELEVSHALRGGVSARVRQTTDIAAHPGATTGAVGLARETDAPTRWSWTAGADLAWGSVRFLDAYLGSGDRGLRYVHGEAAVRLRMSGAYVRAHVEADAALDPTEARLTMGRTPLGAGLALGREF